MKTLQYVSYLLLGAATCLACSDGVNGTNGSLESTLTAPTQHCGGNLANAPTCPDGFECVPDPASHLPFGDVGGICQAAGDDDSDDDGAEEGPQHCGGNLANAPTCPDGFECVPDPASHLPFGDVGGICQVAADDDSDDDGAEEGPQHCGGNIANAPTCPDGFECVPDPASHLPFGDVGGICQVAAPTGPDDSGCGDSASHD
jgi:hypothetical protein